MSSFEVAINAGSLSCGHLGPNTGEIWIKIDGDGFPAEGWRDFPEVILAWWLMALVSLAAGTGKEVVLRFMDGPFECKVTNAGDAWTLELIDRGLLQRRGPVHRVSPKEVCLQVLTAAQAVARAVAERGLVARDSPGLRIALERCAGFPTVLGR